MKEELKSVCGRIYWSTRGRRPGTVVHYSKETVNKRSPQYVCNFKDILRRLHILNFSSHETIHVSLLLKVSNKILQICPTYSGNTLRRPPFGLKKSSRKNLVGSVYY